MTLTEAVLASYMLGAIPTSQIVAKLAAGIDLRTVGSRNLGATNLFRQLGWKYALPVWLFDTAKGVVPVAVFGQLAGLGYRGSFLLGLVAVLGHVFSVFTGFRGGKGVATGSGVVLGLAPGAFVACLVIWALVTRWSGYVSLASILAAMVLPPSVWLTYPSRRSVVVWLAVLAALVIWMHRANIRRLLAGTESRFGRWRRAEAGGRGDGM